MDASAYSERFNRATSAATASDGPSSIAATPGSMPAAQAQLPHSDDAGGNALVGDLLDDDDDDEDDEDGSNSRLETLPAGTTQHDSLPSGTTQLETLPSGTTQPESLQARSVVDESEHHLTREASSELFAPPRLPASLQPPATESPRKRAKLSHDAAPQAGPSTVTTTTVKAKPNYERPVARVFAQWQELGMFPATVVSCSASKAELFFDDGSAGSFDLKDIRRCALRRNDRFAMREDLDPPWIPYDGICYVSSATYVNLDPLTEIDFYDNDPEGGGSDLVAVYNTYIPPALVSRLDDRKVTRQDFDANNGYDLLPITPSFDLSLPAPSDKQNNKLFYRCVFILTSGTSQPAAAGTSRRSSSKPSTRSKKAASEVPPENDVERLIVDNGGVVADIDALVFVHGQAGSRIVVRGPCLVGQSTYTRVFLIAQSAATTPKYLSALACGIPCLSQAFVPHAVRTKSLDDYSAFKLPAGSVPGLGAFDVAGAQARCGAPTSIEQLLSQRLGSYQAETYGIGYDPWYSDAIAQERPRSNGVFANRKFLLSVDASGSSSSISSSKQTRTFQQTWRTILACAGAVQVDFVKDASSALMDDLSDLGLDLDLGTSDEHDHDNDNEGAESIYDYVIVEEKLTSALTKRVASINGRSLARKHKEGQGQNKRRRHRIVASLAWVKECIIMGSVMRPTDLAGTLDK